MGGVPAVDPMDPLLDDVIEDLYQVAVSENEYLEKKKAENEDNWDVINQREAERRKREYQRLRLGLDG